MSQELAGCNIDALLLLLLLQVRDNPIWFVSFVWCEVLVQLPFFFIAAYAYLAGERDLCLHFVFTGWQQQHSLQLPFFFIAAYAYLAGERDLCLHFVFTGWQQQQHSLQLPFFFIAAYAYLTGAQDVFTSSSSSSSSSSIVASSCPSSLQPMHT
jgi:hypothetical protein